MSYMLVLRSAVAKNLDQMLKAVAARASISELFKVIGADGESTDTDPVAKVRARAAEIRKTDPDLSESDAMSQAMAADPAAAQAAFYNS